MKIQPVKGTRDFYPREMGLRNWLSEAWRRVSLRNGFLEFDGPVLEYLDLFRIKSGEEIVSQLFSFTDRGGRELALRPEITPTLARMVSAKINSLPRPIKWFSIPRLWRAEKPQRGRLREFFQWNVDVIGSDDVLADAECVFTCVDFLREVGLTPQEVVVRIGSRPLTMAALRRAGVGQGQMEAALAALDKRPQVPPEAFAEIARAAGIPAERLGDIARFQDAAELSAAGEALGRTRDVRDELDKLDSLMRHLRQLGAADYCRVDMRIVRGLAYYTGIVYEVYDVGESLRAVAGGGRYDNLLAVLDGPEIGATGFGMGDPVLSILLEEKGKLPELVAGVDCFVIDGAEGTFPQALEAVGALRRAGIAADYSYARSTVGKQLKEANRRNARQAVILFDQTVGVKDLQSGQQQDVPKEDFLSQPGKYLV